MTQYKLQKFTINSNEINKFRQKVFITPIWMVCHQLKMPLNDHNILQGRNGHLQILADLQGRPIQHKINKTKIQY